MAEFNLESAIKKGVEAAINKPVYGGKSITEWAAIGMKAPQWISVEDRLPEENSLVIVYDEGSKKVWSSRYLGATFYEEDNSPYFTYRVNWWMPFPKPPKEVDMDG